MADVIVLAVLAGIGVWAMKQLRARGSSCCGKGGCSCCAKGCPSKEQP